MTREEYVNLFHQAEINLVAFKQVNDCDEELRKMVEMAIEAERKKLQGQIETLGAMYELASKQRDVLMDEQRAQVAAWRAEHAINKAKNA